MLVPDESFGYLTNLLARLFQRALDRRIGAFGLSHGQFPTLLTLWHHPGLTQAEVARRISIEQPTLANTLKRMERDGLIERRPDPADGRRMLLFPSTAALALRDAVLAEAVAVNAHAAEGLGEAERLLAKRLLRAMIANLEADAAAPGVGFTES